MKEDKERKFPLPLSFPRQSTANFFTPPVSSLDRWQTTQMAGEEAADALWACYSNHEGHLLYVWSIVKPVSYTHLTLPTNHRV